MGDAQKRNLSDGASSVGTIATGAGAIDAGFGLTDAAAAALLGEESLGLAGGALVAGEIIAGGLAVAGGLGLVAVGAYLAYDTFFAHNH